MRRMLVTLTVLAGVVVAGILGAAFLSGLARPADAANPCPDASPTRVGEIVVPRGPVAGYCQSELVNAAQIMSAARDLGIGTHTQTVGVMTAIGETRLRNLDYGDAAGPDSRGLFQQRDNGAWGTLADRMNPYVAARSFFTRLTKVPGWQTMDPGALAHIVQVNSDPDYYGQFWPQAQAIVAALTPASP